MSISTNRLCLSGEASRAAYRQQTEKLRSSQAAYKAEVKDNSGGKATKEQKKLAAVISKTTGYTVELVNGAIDSGIADTQALGSIDTSNAVITLDVSKGNYAATTLHEVTHFIAVNAPEQFARFKNEVIRFEINEGRLASDLNKYAKMYSNIDNINDLTDEMAANAAEALLKSDDFIVDLMSDKKFVQSMAQESPSIAKKIFNKLQELIDAIRDFLKHSDVEHEIARAISKDAQTLETIRGLWLDAFKTAIHNRAVQHENTNNSEESADNKSSSIKFSKMETYPYDMQTVIREYIDSVDNNIKDFAEYAVQHKNQGWRRIELSSISNKETEDIKNLVNIDVTGYKRTANVNTFVHIEKRHGANGEEDHSLADINDVARMNFVLENYDDIKISRYQNGNIVYSSEFYNSDGSHAIVIQYSKKINGTYYVAEAVPDSKAKELRVTSAYINKKGEYHEPNAEAPRVTSETHHELSPFANNISHSSENVNTQNQKNLTDVKKFSITENMTEEERYNELKDKTISPAHPDMSKVAYIDIESYRTLRAKDAKKPIRQLAQMLGIHNVNYSNSSIDFEFGFSKGSLDSSIQHQKDYGGDYADYAKMLTCLNELVKNAELIEVHKDYKNNADLNKTYVLFSALEEGDTISPVQFEVKEYYSAEEKLYLSIALTKMEKSAVIKESHVENSIASTPLVADFNISISQLFANVNTSDAKFLKYVPDQFLTDKQIEAKRQAQKIDYEKYGRYKELFEPSVRFSIPEQTDGEYETLLHENEQLHEQVKALRAEMKLTRGHKVKPDAVAKLARRLKKEYSSNIDADELAKRLEDVFNYVASDDAIANIAHEVMYAIAGDIIDNSQRLNTDLRDEYNEIRDLIRHTTIFVSDSMKSEIEHLYGDYDAFRKSMFGKMKLSTKTGIDKKGINVDSFYQDLMSAAPEWFDDVTEQEMLPRIADFLNATDAYMENPYEQDTEQYISDLAQEIFNQYFETPEIKTFADKQQQQLQKVINSSRKQIAKLRLQSAFVYFLQSSAKKYMHIYKNDSKSLTIIQ